MCKKRRETTFHKAGQENGNGRWSAAFWKTVQDGAVTYRHSVGELRQARTDQRWSVNFVGSAQLRPKQENACWWLSQRAFRCFTVRLHSSSQMVVKECKIKRNRVPLFPVYDPCFSILLFSYINPFIMFNSKNACAFNCHVHAKISQRVCPTFPTISIDILSEIYIESKFLHHQSVAYSACKF